MITMPLEIWWHELNTWEPEKAHLFCNVTLALACFMLAATALLRRSLTPQHVTIRRNRLIDKNMLQFKHLGMTRKSGFHFCGSCSKAADHARFRRMVLLVMALQAAITAAKLRTEMSWQ
jgi:hypothetical protein